MRDSTPLSRPDEDVDDIMIGEDPPGLGARTDEEIHHSTCFLFFASLSARRKVPLVMQAKSMSRAWGEGGGGAPEERISSDFFFFTSRRELIGLEMGWAAENELWENGKHANTPGGTGKKKRRNKGRPETNFSPSFCNTTIFVYLFVNHLQLPSFLV